MNICYLSAPGGGLDTNVRVLAPALVKAGHQVLVLYIHFPGDALPPTESANGYRIYHTAIGNWHYYAHRATFGLTSLPRIVREFEYANALTQVVTGIQKQSALELLELPEGFVMSRLLERVPVVMRLHSSAWMCNRLFDEPPALADLIEAWLEAHTLERTNSISSPSAFVADYVRQSCHVKKAIQVIRYPVDTERFTPDRQGARLPLVLFVGRVEKRKGADVLMRAIPQVLAKYPDSQFAFAGHIADDLKVQADASRANVQFLGVRPREELVVWYQRASVFVLPTLWDNSPNTIYEAMACGTPIVATRVGGIPELVDDGVTGLLVPPGDENALADAMIALLVDAARRAQMGRRAREKAVAEYSVEKVAAMTMAFYERALVG